MTYKFDWQEDGYVIDPYNRWFAPIPGFPGWEIRRKWDGSRDEVAIKLNGHHVGYAKEDIGAIERFIMAHVNKAA